MLAHTSATGNPASPSANMAIIWLSVNFDFLIALPQKKAEASIFNLSTVWGSLRAGPLVRDPKANLDIHIHQSNRVTFTRLRLTTNQKSSIFKIMPDKKFIQ
jgi:hypothetical protein